jgi:4-hydroxy-3-methylbut-2-enyl diphosphate reductase
VSPPTDRVAFVTQTTLGLDDTAEIVDVLRRRFPAIASPAKEDICYATTNRQRAVAALLDEIDALLVVGSANSSNSRRLVEVAAARGVAAHLVEDERAMSESWLDGVETLGITAGASTPEVLVERLLDWLAERTDAVVEERGDPIEDVEFRLPAAVRTAT